MDMNRPAMTFQKGKKIWIEFEAKEDGDLLDSEVLEIYRRENFGSFTVTQLIINESYFNQVLANDIRFFLQNKGL